MLEHLQNKNSINPFPGLRAFKGSEKSLFFGREEHVQDVLGKLEKNHFVAVVGTSGTGKSSLIKAGVLPAIEARNQNNLVNNWMVVTTNPGSDPIGNLAKALSIHPGLNDLGDAEVLKGRILELMDNNSLGLVQSMRPLIKEGSKLLLLVDQFEEVFRYSEQGQIDPAYHQFVHLLIDTIKQKDVPIYIILTLRSDFLGDCVSFEGLPEAINDGHYLVPRMNSAQIRRAIIGPINYAEGKISPRLIQEITQDLGNNPDQLPILQHALMRCWDYWKLNSVEGEPMDIHHFEAIGGLNKALSTHADEAFEELSADEKKLIEKIFKCLTEKKGDNRGVRRPMSLLTLTEVVQSSKENILDCIAPFQKQGRSFILPGLDQPIRENTILDISHESLMRGWDRLRIWVDEEMESAEFYQRLCTAAVLHKKAASALWRDPELQLAIDWKANQMPITAWGNLYDPNFEIAISFLEESKSADIESQQKQKRRNFLLRTATLIFILVISGLAAWALLQTKVANEKSTLAEQRSLEALNQKSIAEGAKEKALLASNEAIQAKTQAEKQAEIAGQQKVLANIERSKAEQAAFIANQEKQTADEQRQVALNQRQLAEQKSREALLQKQKADSARIEALRLRLVAISQKLAFESEQITRDPELSSLLAIQSYKLAFENGGNSNVGTIYGAATKAIKQIAPDYSSVVLQSPEEVLSMKVREGKISFVDKTGTYFTYDSNKFNLSGQIKSNLKPEQISTAFLSEDGAKRALALNDFSLLISGNNPIDGPRKFLGHSGLVRGFNFLNNNGLMISGGRDNQLIVWVSESKFEKRTLEAKVKAICMQPNAIQCYVGCENGSLYACPVGSKEVNLFAPRPNTRIEALDISSDGEIIAAGYSDGVIRLFKKSGEIIKELSGIGSVVSIKISQKNDLMAVSFSSKTLTFYALSNLTMLPIELKLERPIRGIDIESETGDVFVACSDKTIHRFPSRTEKLITQLIKEVKRPLSKDEWNTFIGSDFPYNEKSSISTIEQ